MKHLQTEISALRMIRVRAIIERHQFVLAELSEARQARAGLIARIASCAEGGVIAVVESGRDCDGCAYTGHVSTIPATVAAFDAHYDHVAQWADGPFWFAVEKPSEARGIKATSRDLALEAFEDGHSHCLHV